MPARRPGAGSFQARYLDANGILQPAPETFETKTDADDWLAEMQTSIRKKDWRDPDAGAVNFAKYADAWTTERGLMPTTLELYRRLLRLHLEPAFGELDLDEITPPLVRAWRAELRATGKHTTAAKAYRLPKSVMATATDDELIRRNQCRLKGAGKESAEECGIASIEQVYELAELVGPRWRAMVLLADFTALRPEELAELRRKDINLVAGTVQVRLATPELNTGRRALGDTKSEAGKRVVTIPAAVLPDVRLHLELFAGKEQEGLLFVGEKGAPFHRTTFGRGVAQGTRQGGHAGLPLLRPPAHRHTLAAATGASLKELMARMGQSSVRSALIYQHATRERDQKIADGRDAEINRTLGRGATPPDES
ncbi:tyrosine-type recombinase/integrase [Kitasatospora sp. NPDC087861]|uniref:tyrosine-type recombinase/integrase n=1 Tax=Kitasatospora sp. NPDC087861 TaxID=3364070 RepID=UPI00380A9030